MARQGLTPDSVTVAGAELADEIGFDAVSPAELARRLGVRTASMYAHIANAADLRARIAALALDEMAEQISLAVLGRAGREALVGMMNAYRDYARRHPGRFTAATWQPGAGDQVLAAGRRHAELTRAVLLGYHLPVEAVPHATRLLGSSLRGFVTLEASGSFDQSRPAAADSWPYVIDGLHTLLSHWNDTFPQPEPEPNKK
ncbi:TetR/AcrR family transcriptional regulator [Nakamurella silvestris]|nr:TetR/AcrR family transcriptional regulator [Nakamurella silvestris]